MLANDPIQTHEASGIPFREKRQIALVVQSNRVSNNADMKIGALLKAYMYQRHLSLRDVAQEVGCDHNTISQIIKGKPVRMAIFLKFMAWLMAPETSE